MVIELQGILTYFTFPTRQVQVRLNHRHLNSELCCCIPHQNLTSSMFIPFVDYYSKTISYGFSDVVLCMCVCVGVCRGAGEGYWEQVSEFLEKKWAGQPFYDWQHEKQYKSGHWYVQQNLLKAYSFKIKRLLMEAFCVGMQVLFNGCCLSVYASTF